MRAIMTRLAAAAAALGLVHGAAAVGRADVLASNTAGTVHNAIGLYAGQSFTTAAGPSETDIAFNFFSDVPATTPFATGTGFLLSQAYTGLPGDLGTSTPGFLGEATAAGGFYEFGPGVTLAGGTQYWFYENALIPAGDISGGNVAPGGNDYFTFSAGADFRGFPQSTNFEVTGTPVPEPSSLALCGLGVVGAAWYARRRKAATA
jgi:hypothetical protein